MKFLFLLLLPLQLFSQSTSILFKNVSIIDVEKGIVIANQNVLVRENKIKAISSKSLSAGKATIIDATGKYLMPGLCDFNASVLEYESLGHPVFKLMLANGITSVRDLKMKQSPAEAYQIKKRIENGELLGPRLYLSGKTLIDRPPFQKGDLDKTLLITSAKEAIHAVDSMINWGADVIDLRTIHTKPILQAIIKRAHQKNKKVLARFSGNWIEVSENGVDAFTHPSDLWRITSKGREKYFQFSKGDSMQFITPAEFYNRVLPSLGGVDTPYFYSLVNAFKKQNTWIITNTPSFFPSKKKFEHGDSSRNQYRTSRQRQLMFEDLELSNQITLEEVKSPKPAISIIIMAAQAGVNLISGTQLEGFITPGMSLHDMLYWLVDGGLTPAEALRTATTNPALFLNKQKEIGTVEAGKWADLVLLDANPLQDINNTRKINAVVVNGRLLQRKDLDKMLEDAKERVKQL